MKTMTVLKFYDTMETLTILIIKLTLFEIQQKLYILIFCRSPPPPFYTFKK